MLDRESRNRLVGMIEAFLDEQTTAFKFDDQITQLSGETEDETVDHVVQAWWPRFSEPGGTMTADCQAAGNRRDPPLANQAPKSEDLGHPAIP